MSRVLQRPGRPVQRGMSLIFALVALLALSLAALALVRSVDTGASVLGNIGFKQDATVLADPIVARAVNWLGLQSSVTLNAGHAPTQADGVAYYATSLAGLDATGQQIDPSSAAYATRVLIDWNADQCSGASKGRCVAASTAFAWPPAPANAYASVSYVITRLCATTGAPTATTNNCQMPSQASSTSANKGQLSYANYTRFGASGGPYYRVIVRVVGARNSTSFIEAVVHF